MVKKVLACLIACIICLTSFAVPATANPMTAFVPTPKPSELSEVHRLVETAQEAGKVIVKSAPLVAKTTFRYGSIAGKVVANETFGKVLIVGDMGLTVYKLLRESRQNDSQSQFTEIPSVH